MELSEAIKHAEEVATNRRDDLPYIEQGIKDGFDTQADYDKCLACAEEHRQLAEWLKELKRLQSLEVHQDTYEENDVLFSYHEMMGLCTISVCTPVSTE